MGFNSGFKGLMSVVSVVCLQIEVSAVGKSVHHHTIQIH